MIENAQGFLKAIFGNEPFFGGVTRGDQTSPRRDLLLTALVSMLAANRQEPIRVLEIGSWVGMSALTWAHAIDRLCPAGGSVLCVDSWAPYFADADLMSGQHYADMDSLAQSAAVYELFCHNAGTAPSRAPIHHQRGLAADILPTLASGSFDVVYVDGSHYYSEVKSDLAEAKRLVAATGIVAGDDLEIQLSPAIESAIRSHLARDFVSLPNGIRCHPGVTLAVAEIFGPVSMMAGTWFMRRQEDEFQPITNLSGVKMLIPKHWPPLMKEEARQLLSGSTTG